uniref:CDK-activating kinase assembly factor MAT1 n=1 Tax=Sphaerodactylus townsendi TaxID=933632 RepID=A0ACB8G6G2_9SAUR
MKLFNLGQQIVLAPAPKIKEALYEYQPLHVETYGPPVPEVELLGKLGGEFGWIALMFSVLPLAAEEK